MSVYLDCLVVSMLRSGSVWGSPRRVKKKAGLSLPGMKYHFAVGGMYCLSRAMLHKTMKWIV